MKIIISPAKKMKSEPDLYPCRELPVFLAEARQLADWIQKLTYQEAKELWKCSDAIAKENFRRFQDMDLERGLTPAILSYEGIQYQYMAPAVFEEREISSYPLGILRSGAPTGWCHALPFGNAGKGDGCRNQGLV